MTNKILYEYLNNSLDLKKYDSATLLKYLQENRETVERLFALHIFKGLDSEKHALLQEIYESTEGFRKRLLETWKQPIERLDTLTYMCTEIVAGIRTRLTQDDKKPTAKLNIATRLHSRAIQVSREISHLLHGGFADGAFARWRTLHETTVILKFIAEGDEDLARRFTDFQSVTRLIKATRYNKNNELEFEPISDFQLEQFEQKQRAILDKYEENFANKFGWALKALNKGCKPNAKADYIDIEKFVGLGFLRNHYSFANQYIHAGVDSIGYKLGTSMSNIDLLLTGPSNEGLLEPIQCTSLSLIHATVALISAFPDDEGLLQIPVFWLWHDALKLEASEASDELQKKGDVLRT
ncbi:DUF5677 domain-containing protein [Pseudomonas moorei]|uniref:DUF5677 domain-containing protein n=1 Tax=Pseudomonas moorei TaxID=395599 RepID=UPI001FF5DF80|nr:DUF5677 domain-containing protein [Pseudomonas moorei]